MASTTKGWTEILCRLETALDDLLVVSYRSDSDRTYHGVLIDTNKRSCPLGISPQGGFGRRLHEDNPRDYVDYVPEDTFPTVARRHTYFQDGNKEKPPLLVPTSKGGRSFLAQDRKLGVRLRARQVLCSKCTAVCNEKGENVRDSANREKENRKAVSDTGQQAAASRQKQARAQMKKEKVCETRQVKHISGLLLCLEHSATNSGVHDSNVERGSRRLKGQPPELKVETDPLKEKTQKKLAKKFSMVPKVRRLGQAEIDWYSERSSDIDLSPDQGVRKNQQVAAAKKSLVGPSAGGKKQEDGTAEDEQDTRRQSDDGKETSSSTQPLRIKFSNIGNGKVNRNSCGRPQYSIVSAGTEQDGEEMDADVDDESRRMRRKRSTGSMEDLWHENVLEENQPPLKKVLRSASSNAPDAAAAEADKPSPVLKISFGKQSSTVLKIPARPVLKQEEQEENNSSHSEAEGEAGGPPARRPAPSINKETKGASASSKAAKKALKRARREAQRRAMYSGGMSPVRSYIGGRSPASNLGGRSPATTGQSPAHRSTLPSPARILPGSISPGRPFSQSMSPARFNSPAHPMGSGSPAHTQCPASPAYTLLCPSSQKLIIRKKKKAKKHKRSRTRSGGSVGDDRSAGGETPAASADAQETLWRPHIVDETKPSPQQDGKPSPGRLSSSSRGSSRRSSTDDEIEFKGCDKSPGSDGSRPGISVESATLEGGHTMCVGDVVWGKTGTNPWWPGKVVNLLMLEKGGKESPDKLVAHAQVSWYTSATTSLLPCSNVKPFLESFEVQYNKRKRGSYKEAVRLATDDARQASSVPLFSPSNSPRAVDCVS